MWTLLWNWLVDFGWQNDLALAMAFLGVICWVFFLRNKLLPCAKSKQDKAAFAAQSFLAFFLAFITIPIPIDIIRLAVMLPNTNAFSVTIYEKLYIGLTSVPLFILILTTIHELYTVKLT